MYYLLSFFFLLQVKPFCSFQQSSFEDKRCLGFMLKLIFFLMRSFVVWIAKKGNNGRVQTSPSCLVWLVFSTSCVLKLLLPHKMSVEQRLFRKCDRFHSGSHLRNSKLHTAWVRGFKRRSLCVSEQVLYWSTHGHGQNVQRPCRERVSVHPPGAGQRRERLAQHLRHRHRVQ